MNYTKPELHVLGNASTLIENMLPNKPAGQIDGHQNSGYVGPAYDLDE
jgi:hypothetical protein